MADLTESLVGHKTAGWMTQFKASEWEKLSPNERLSLLQEAENRVAKEQCRLARKIIPQKMEGAHEGWDGYYTRTEPGNIYINEELINSTDIDKKSGLPGYSVCTALQTVYHEGRHAFQDDCLEDRCAVIDGKLQFGILLKDLAKKRGIVDDEALELWRMQRQAYFLPPSKDKEKRKKELPHQELLYYFQPIEDDAESFAIAKLNELAEMLDDTTFCSAVKRKNGIRCDNFLAAKDSLGSDYKKTVAEEVSKRYALIRKKVSSVQAEQKPPAPARKALVNPARMTEKRNFSLVQYAMLGGTLLWLLLMYWIAAPSGLLQHLLWFVSAAIPFVPVVLLLRAFPALRNKKGGIMLLTLFAVLLLLIQKLYFWLSIAYLIVGTISLFKGISNILPDTYTVTLENADGTTTTETHILGDDPEQDIRSIDSGYTSQGYTKK